MLRADAVTHRHPGAEAPALDAVSLALAPGELVALLGPNGSGKSTLLRVLTGVLRPYAGAVALDGTPVAAWERRAFAQRVGVVPQSETAVFPLRGAEAVMLGRYARLAPLAAPRADDHAAVREALERCDAWGLRDRRIDTLSGGEWQRVRIARALAQRPALLLLDEPTAALDLRHEMELFELVRALVDGGLGCLVITHQINLAARYADRLVLLHRGRLVAEGPPPHVLTPPHVSAVFDWPVAVTTWCDGAPQVVPLRPADLPHQPKGPSA